MNKLLGGQASFNYANGALKFSGAEKSYQLAILNVSQDRLKRIKKEDWKTVADHVEAILKATKLLTDAGVLVTSHARISDRGVCNITAKEDDIYELSVQEMYQQIVKIFVEERPEQGEIEEVEHLGYQHEKLSKLKAVEEKVQQLTEELNVLKEENSILKRSNLQIQVNQANTEIVETSPKEIEPVEESTESVIVESQVIVSSEKGEVLTLEDKVHEMSQEIKKLQQMIDTKDERIEELEKEIQEIGYEKIISAFTPPKPEKMVQAEYSSLISGVGLDGSPVYDYNGSVKSPKCKLDFGVEPINEQINDEPTLNDSIDMHEELRKQIVIQNEIIKTLNIKIDKMTLDQEDVEIMKDKIRIELNNKNKIIGGLEDNLKKLKEEFDLFLQDKSDYSKYIHLARDQKQKIEQLQNEISEYKELLNGKLKEEEEISNFKMKESYENKLNRELNELREQLKEKSRLDLIQAQGGYDKALLKKSEEFRGEVELININLKLVEQEVIDSESKLKIMNEKADLLGIELEKRNEKIVNLADELKGIKEDNRLLRDQLIQIGSPLTSPRGMVSPRNNNKN